MEPNRAQWGSKIGFILAAAGSAVGLGNIWKFPGKAYEGGGGAFILIYLAIVILIGLPVMLSELSIGRAAQANAIDSFGKLGHPKYKWVGWFGILVAFIIACYYSHVGGWVLRYIASYITEPTVVYSDPLGYFYQLLGYNAATGETFFPLTAILFGAIFMAITCFIIVKGVEGGIEKFNKVGMPALFVILIILLVRALTMPGASEGLRYMLVPDWSKVTFSTVLSALGQAFFSLSLGMAIMVTYGSYVSDDANLGKSINQIEFFDTLVAFLAAAMIIPAVYTFMGREGMEASGPSLMFVSLPKVFEAMGIAGHVVGALFFLLVFFAALTSAVSVMEAIVSGLMDRFHMSRARATALETVVAVVMCLLVCLGYNGLYFDILLPNGAHAQLLDVMDYVSNNCLMPIVAIGTCALIGWTLSPKVVIDEVEKNGQRFGRRRLYTITIKIIAPILLTVLLLKSVGLLTVI